MKKIISNFAHSALLVGIFTLSPWAWSADFQRYLNANDDWQPVAAVELKADQLLAVEGEGSDLLLSAAGEVENLLGNVYLGDTVLTLEFMLSEAAQAAVYLQGRYGVILSADKLAGGIMPRWDGEQNTMLDAVAPLSQAAKEAGQWQTLEIRFRAPRYDDASRKAEQALILEARLNGQTVLKNHLLPGFTEGSVNPWETTSGPTMLRVLKGQLALRNLQTRRADFAALSLPEVSGGETNEAELMDFIALGENSYRALGCVECHAVNKGDASMKTGPNLFSLLQHPPRDREIVEPEGETRLTLKADSQYLQRSIRDPGAELATYESGDKQGEAYLPVMPPYREQTLSDQELLAIGAYLETLNDAWQQGPVEQLVDAGGPEQYDPLTDDLQLLVGKQVRIQRGPMAGVSSRAIHVGQPNAVNYSFDPQFLGIAKLWQGGFLEASGELKNRGGGGLKMGFESREIPLGESGVLFAPLNTDGKMIDFAFKEALFGDTETVRASLHSPLTQAERIAVVDAQFLGYSLPTAQQGEPLTFHYRIGKNRLAVTSRIDADGRMQIDVTGQRAHAQSFMLAADALTDIEVSAGVVQGDQWQLPKGADQVVLRARLALAAKAWRPPVSDFTYERQPLRTVAATATLPAGYSIESYLPPQDNYGRDQLFEALGLAVAKDGTVVVVTRTAGIWRLVDGQWQLFAEGLFDALGVVIEDDKGLDLVVSQKAELTRVRDTDGDLRADSFETLFDAHSYHGNYHTYMHGPAKGNDGAWYVNLNLAHTDEAVYKANGEYMGSQGGLSGWMIRVDPEGGYELYASGLRSPAGLSRSPEGELWYTENQGEYVSTSKLFLVREGAFYGHPSGLVDLPDMTPASADIQWERVKDKREAAVLLFPHNRVANAPGHPVWDTTGGKFGPFAGQMLVGDQTQSNLLRVTTEQAGDVRQGVVIPFMGNLASGVMRAVFLPDNSLLVGQTGRGWQAKGGHVASLQRIRWDGQTVAPAIHNVSVTGDGFAVTLTQPLKAGVSAQTVSEVLSINSWLYRDAPDYGSPEMDLRDEAFNLSLSEDRQTLQVSLVTTEQPTIHPEQTARVYHLSLAAAGFFEMPAAEQLDAYYSLYRFAP